MMENQNLAQKVVSKIILIVGLFLLLFSIIAVIQNTITLQDAMTKGVTGLGGKSVIAKDSILIVQIIEENTAAYEAGIRTKDTILKVNGITPSPELIKTKSFFGPREVGSKVILTLKKGNRTEERILIKRKDTFDNLIIIGSYLIVLPILMLAYVFIGFWIFVKNAFSYIIALITLACFAFGLIMYMPLELPYADSFFSEKLYFFVIKNFMTNFIFLVPAFWVNLLLVFPERNKLYEKKKNILLMLIYFIPVTAVIIAFLGTLFTVAVVIRQIISVAGILYIFFGMISGIFILHSASKKNLDILKKRQYRLILFGIKYGGISIILGWLFLVLGIILIAFSGGNLIIIFLLLFILCQIGGLIIPFTFLNTFYGNKILETEWALKKKLIYFSATAALFTIYLLITYFIGNYFITVLEITNTSIIVLVPTVIAITFYPINKRLQSLLVQKLYPERTKYQQAVKEFARNLQNILEINTLLQNLSTWLEKNFNIKPAIAFSLDTKKLNANPFRPVEKNSIIKKINDGSVFFWDELPEKENTEFNDIEKEWIIKNNISLTIPLISYGECVGVLNIGKKINNEDFNGNDIEILKDAAAQSAMALQSLSLQSEYIEKKRLDKELNVARVIQTQLLPHTIPSVKGLDIFGKMRPCFEVAGDYFDILPIDENKTVLALGDVSGKGAGAALLMSNLQAGLRSALRFTTDLSNIVFEINNIINQNTSPEQFITFFIGIWNAENNSFQYVNAGHNPALILGPDGKVTKLEATGFFLGPIPGMQYASKDAILGKEDILIIYTDGIEETFNPKDEQYGVERIIQTVQDNRGLKSEEIGKILYKNIEDFSEGLPNSDDATLIIAKVE